MRASAAVARVDQHASGDQFTPFPPMKGSMSP
jgi:hypothetical protein